MKLQELAKSKVKQVGKIMESYFNKTIDVTSLSLEQAQGLLAKTSTLVKEVQSSTARHTSQNNPAYLQAMMLEQALEEYVREGTAQSRDPYAGGTSFEKKQMGVAAMAPADIADPAEEDEMEEACGTVMAGKKKKTYEAKQINEADVEEAQVTLAAQDIVDRIQKMYEDVAEMQYKDLPNLAQMMKAELGINQTQAYFDATNTAVSTLVTALEQAKTDLEGAMAPVTGEEVISPDEFTTDADTDIDLDAGVDNDTPPEVDDEETLNDLDTDLGRERR